MRSDSDGATGPNVENRAAADRFTKWSEWLLVDGSRLHIAAGTAAGVFCLLVGLDAVGIVAFADGGPISRLSSGLTGGLFSLITIVVTINQLILSREFTTPEESRERLQGLLTFREDIEESAGVSTVPAEPTELLDLLAVVIDERARTLRESVEDHPDEKFQRLVKAYTDEVMKSSDRLDESLERSDFGTFRALSATMSYDDAWQIYAARYLRNGYGDVESAATDDALEDLLQALEFFSTAREQFKTTYMQRELTRFSRLIVLAGAVGVVASLLLSLLYGAPDAPTIPAASLSYVASALVAVAVYPLALLTTYILRTATVTRRTVTVGPVLTDSAPEDRLFSGFEREEEYSSR